MIKTPKTTLRRATTADHDFLLDVRRQGLRDDVVRVWGTWDGDRQSRYIDRLLSGDDLRIICCGGEDIGMLTVETRDGALHIENIVLLPSWQGKGIGTELVSNVCDRAAAQGVPVTLEVLKVSRAVSLYGRLGFSVVDETETHLRMKRTPATSN